MIVVTVGTERHPFDRLVAEVDRLAAEGAFGDEEVFVQTGSCNLVPRACRAEKILDFGAMEELVRGARLVVAHAGAGSFMLCRRLGVPIILVPRLRAHGENVDDHQVRFAEHLAALGLARAVTDVGDLGEVMREELAAHDAGGAARHVPSMLAELNALMEEWGLRT